MRLATILFVSAGFAAAQDERTHVYDVRAISVKLTNYRAPTVGFNTSDQNSLLSGGEEEGTRLPGQDIRLLLSMNVAPGTWDTPPNSIEYQDGTLIVRHKAATHDKVKAFLAFIRAWQYRQVVAQAEVLELAPGVLEAEAGRVLTAEDLKAVNAACADPAKGRRIAVLRAVASPGQRVHSLASGSASYVRDFDVEIAEKQTIADPVIGNALEGWLLDFRPDLSPDGSIIFIDATCEAAESTGMAAFETGDPALGILELPRTRVAQTRTNVAMRSGSTLVLASVTIPGAEQALRRTVILLRADVAGDPLPPWPKAEGERAAIGIDISGLVRNVVSYPGPGLGEIDISSGEAVAFIPPEDESELMMSGDTLVELVLANVEPELWGNPANSVHVEWKTLFVVAPPAAAEAVSKFVGDLIRARARLVSVDAWLVALDQPGWNRRRQALAGADVTDEAWKELTDAASRGGDVRLLAAVSAVGQSGSRFHAAQGTRTAAVMDYDVEIAQGASALDPVMAEFTDGLSLDVTPLLVGQGEAIQLDLRPVVVTGSEPITFRLSEKGARVQESTASRFGVETQTLVAAGRPTLAATTSRVREGKTEVLLLFVRARGVEIK